MLGVCYYPEHWPQSQWAEDARRMAAMGIRYVRIGEFAWSLIEPQRHHYVWEWLDQAIETLAAAGLRVVLGTPTATPPKWLVDEHPDILAVDRDGRPRRFGSRRHYCFSSPTYRRECARIVTALAERYGQDEAVVGWQLDNEYGCHDTTRSYSTAARQGFRAYLTNRYERIEALNEAWGTNFWSQTYRHWDEIDLPNLTVTEANPSHWMDFLRFASAEVAAFSAVQVEVLRRLSPGRFITHNFMAFFNDFDPNQVMADLDLASWDSYPLGFLEVYGDVVGADESERRRWARTGHPDIVPFNHDLYRSAGRGRWWIMEQQPGPVNWAPWNAIPAPGMIRLWGWEALAHGAEVVSYFRWRQAPMAQEQMHAGLLRPDSQLSPGGEEVTRLGQELAALTADGPLPDAGVGHVALVLSYPSRWAVEVQPHGRDFGVWDLPMRWYSALRRLGLDVDIVPPGTPLDGYRAVVVPCEPMLDADGAAALAAFDGPVIIGPRTGSRTPAFQIPDGLPPGRALHDLVPITVRQCESLRPGLTRTVAYGGEQYPVIRWAEELETDLDPLARYTDGTIAAAASGAVTYLGFWPDAALLARLFTSMAKAAGLVTVELPDHVRLRHRGPLRFVFNYGEHTTEVDAPAGARFVLGGRRVPSHDLAVWIDG